MSARRTRLHVSRRSRFPKRRVRVAMEEVREDSPVGNELDTWVIASGRRRGQDVGTGDEWELETKRPMGRDGQRS
jgi:hypothetical protein